ncbi:MAG: 50S ribosomal protein L5 [Firmicutes bacterium ML8_F2]|jgi:large subunit ribosomal protein L5|nr:MAG: 50S ribosomal protein L5 [Firmicutes bacterium ML8_F2]
MSRMKKKYLEEVRPALAKQFVYKNVMQAPRIEKVVINMGLGEGKENPKILDAAVNDLSIITGQKPIITKARRSVASFKVREGMSIGCKLTLRGIRMYDFLDKLFNIALPRVRDFRGISPHSFDGRGNFTIGIKEQLIFPEIEYSQVERILGMDITIVTTAGNDEEARELLALMGMPFRAA